MKFWSFGEGADQVLCSVLNHHGIWHTNCHTKSVGRGHPHLRLVTCEASRSRPTGTLSATEVTCWAGEAEGQMNIEGTGSSDQCVVLDLSAWESPWKRPLWKGPERFWYLAMKTSSLAVATPACLSEPCLSYRTKIMSLAFPSLEIRPFGKQLNSSILGNLCNAECLWVSFQRKWGIIAHSDQFPLLLLFSLSP